MVRTMRDRIVVGVVGAVLAAFLGWWCRWPKLDRGAWVHGDRACDRACPWPSCGGCREL